MLALNKCTNKLESIYRARKDKKYSCIGCKKDMIVKEGNINKKHFSHMPNVTPCNYISHPNENEKHLQAKYIIKDLLNAKEYITINQKCDTCKKTYIYNEFNTLEGHADVEQSFKHNNHNYRADVALLNNNKISHIFEILNTSRTDEEKRPEPWFELDCNDILALKDIYVLTCKRDYKCMRCKTRSEKSKIIMDESEIRGIIIRDEMHSFLHNNNMFKSEMQKIEDKKIKFKKELNEIESEYFYKYNQIKYECDEKLCKIHERFNQKKEVDEDIFKYFDAFKNVNIKKKRKAGLKIYLKIY